MKTTPAQVYGHPNFVDDVPVQGPTDQGLREAGCWYIKNVLKTTHPACVDCGNGVIPMWTKQSLTPVHGNYSGIGEQISFGGVGAVGFAFGADPTADIFTSLSPEQQKWIVAALTKLNEQIVKSSGTTCPTWGPTIPLAMSCFKPWFNTNYGGKLTTASGQPVMLPPTTAFDQTTLDALLTITGMNPQDFPTPYPGGPADPAAQKKGISTGAIVGIAAAGAAGLGLIYAASRGKSRRR